MATTTLNEMRRCVENRRVFRGNSVFAEQRVGRYVVYSYGYHFPMFVFTGGVWYENADKYSVTTSKQQGKCRPFGVDTVKLSTEDMIRLANGEGGAA